MKESTVEAFERKWECSRYVIDNRNVCDQLFDHLQHGEGLGDFNMIDMNC